MVAGNGKVCIFVCFFEKDGNIDPKRLNTVKKKECVFWNEKVVLTLHSLLRNKADEHWKNYNRQE